MAEHVVHIYRSLSNRNPLSQSPPLGQLSLAMRGRVPTARDLWHTGVGITRSTAFLTTNAFSFCMYLCILRKYCGHFNYYTFSFVPSFIGSLCAILIERPSRRGMLALYTSNVATEAIFNVAVRHGWLPAMRGGSIAVFGGGAAALMYAYRSSSGGNGGSGGAQPKADSIFDIIRFVVGAEEQRVPISGSLSLSDDDARGYRDLDEPNDQPEDDDDDDSATDDDDDGVVNNAAEDRQQRQRTPAVIPFRTIQAAVRMYVGWLEQRLPPPHRTCPHRDSCVTYAVRRAGRLFGVGLALQVTLKCVLQAANVWRRGPGHLRRVLMRTDTVRLAVFLGGFAGLYRVSGMEGHDLHTHCDRNRCCVLSWNSF